MKSYPFVIFLILSSKISFGQLNKFEIGISTGPSLISMRGNEIIDEFHKSTIGFSAGSSFQYHFTRVVTLRSDVTFERKGSILRYNLTDMNGNSLGENTTRSRFDYFNFHVMAQANFGQKVSFFMNAGPYCGYLLQQTEVTEGDYVGHSATNNSSLFKHLDFGITTGLGLAFPVKSNFALSLEVRNNLGIYNVSSLPVINDGTIKTNSTNLLLGISYKFGLKQD